MTFDPTRGGSDLLTTESRSPAFDKRDSNGTEASQRVNGVKAIWNTFGQLGREFSVTEDLQVAATGDLKKISLYIRGPVYLNYGSSMPTVSLITVWRLNIDGMSAETLDEDLPTQIVQSGSSTNVQESSTGANIPLWIGEISQRYTEFLLFSSGQ